MLIPEYCPQCGKSEIEYREANTWQCYDCGKLFEPAAADPPEPNDSDWIVGWY